MVLMGLNGFGKGLNRSSDGSDSDFFLMGLTLGCCVLTVDYELMVVVVSNVCTSVVGLW